MKITDGVTTCNKSNSENWYNIDSSKYLSDSQISKYRKRFTVLLWLIMIDFVVGIIWNFTFDSLNTVIYGNFIILSIMFILAFGFLIPYRPNDNNNTKYYCYHFDAEVKEIFTSNPNSIYEETEWNTVIVKHNDEIKTLKILKDDFDATRIYRGNIVKFSTENVPVDKSKLDRYIEDIVNYVNQSKEPIKVSLF